MPATAKPWSFSGLDAFESCRRRFYGQYEAKKFPYIETPAMKEGNRIDQAFTLRLSAHKVALPTELEKYEPMCQGMERVGTVQAQMNMSLTYDLKPAEFFGKDVWVRGKADIAVIGETAALLFDIKNGNPAWEKPLQLQIYTVGLFQRYPDVQAINAANIWMKTGGIGTVHKYTRAESLPNIAADMYKRVGAIDDARAKNEWPATPSGLCGFCPDKACEHNRS